MTANLNISERYYKSQNKSNKLDALILSIVRKANRSAATDFEDIQKAYHIRPLLFFTTWGAAKQSKANNQCT